MSEFRILSMDGASFSGGSGFVGAALLLAVRKELNDMGHTEDLFDEVDLFAGTSAGAFNALYFANFANPDDGLAGLMDYWVGIVKATQAAASMLRSLVAVTGQSAFLSANPLRDFLTGHFGKDLRLGDLKQQVVVPAFQLAAKTRGRQTWKPRIFDNAGLKKHDLDLDEFVVDVAMRSGSPPLVYPIYQGMSGIGSGYVDGGVFANNPSLVAIGHALRMKAHQSGLEHKETEEKLPPVLLKDLHLLSIGNAWAELAITPTFCDGTANWGFGPWLLDPKSPLLLINLLLDAGVEAAHSQCKAALRRHYRRLNPFVDKPLSVSNPTAMTAALNNLLALPATQADVKKTAIWIVDHWFNDAVAHTTEDGKKKKKSKSGGKARRGAKGTGAPATDVTPTDS